MIKSIRALALVGALLCSLESQAIEADKAAQVAPLSSPDGKSQAASSLSTLAFAAGTSDSKATLSLAGFTPTPFLGNYTLIQVGGEAPVSKDSSDTTTDIGTVSGLSAGSSANASISGYWWPHEPKHVTDARDRICEREFPRLIAGFEFDDAPLSNELVVCGRTLFDTKTLEGIADGFNAAITQCKNLEEGKPAPPDPLATGAKASKPSGPVTTPSECVTLKKRPPQAVLTPAANNPSYLRAVLKEYDVAQGEPGRITVLTFGTKANRQKVAYFNQSDLTALIKDHETGYGANVALSGVWRTWMVSGGFSYEKTFKSLEAVQVCAPVSTGSTSSKCQTGTIGEPPATYSRILFAESRILIAVGALGLAPRLEYDFTASKFAAKLPVYFAPDKSKALTGGVTLGYVTHGDGFGVEVFVGKAFSFF